MAITMPGLFMVEANVGNCGLLACTKKSWANKVRGTANGIAKCARNSFAIPLPTGRFMHDVGRRRPGCYLYSGQGHRLRPERCRRREAHGNQGDWLFLGPHRSSPSATIGFNFSNGVTGIGFRPVDNRDERYAIPVGFRVGVQCGQATITGFAPAAPEPRRRGLSGLEWDSWPPSQCDGLTARNTGVRSHLSCLRAAAKDHSGRIARLPGVHTREAIGECCAKAAIPLRVQNRLHRTYGELFN